MLLKMKALSAMLKKIAEPPTHAVYVRSRPIGGESYLLEWEPEGFEGTQEECRERATELCRANVWYQYTVREI